MKKQNYTDHKDEHIGMEKAYHHSSRDVYRNETSHPKQPKMSDDERMASAKDFKGQAMEIAYGAAGKKGCESDVRKIKAQFNHSYGDYESNSGY
jgi:hypothetical protein